MSNFRFKAASYDETCVFGAQRPGYNSADPIPDAEVTKWMEFMQQQGVKRVCCLLDDRQLSHYESDLLAMYKRFFGEEAVCSAPIEDYELASDGILIESILPFLADSVLDKEIAVVHCSAGSGRTGHVLAAWLVYGHHMTNNEAIEAVIGQGRNPYEAAGGEPSGIAKLNSLLDSCRVASTKATQ